MEVETKKRGRPKLSDESKHSRLNSVLFQCTLTKPYSNFLNLLTRDNMNSISRPAEFFMDVLFMFKHRLEQGDSKKLCDEVGAAFYRKYFYHIIMEDKCKNTKLEQYCSKCRNQ